MADVHVHRPSLSAAVISLCLRSADTFLLLRLLAVYRAKWRRSTPLYCEGDHGRRRGDPCDRFAARNGNFNAFRQPRVLNWRSLGLSLLTAPPDVSTGGKAAPRPTPYGCVVLVFAASVCNKFASTFRPAAFVFWKKESPKTKAFVKRQNKMEPTASAPSLE